MLAPLELETVDATPCSSCGRIHRFRVAISPDEVGRPATMQGFFAACPVSGRRSWYVISLPEGLAGGAHSLRIGPPDDAQWEPEIEDEPVWAQRRSDIERSEAAALGPLTLSPPRGMPHGGFRARSRTTDLLRRALGCPHTP
jgi:hypothetical protein